MMYFKMEFFANILKILKVYFKNIFLQSTNRKVAAAGHNKIFQKYSKDIWK